jgi:probable phosphoglycerate mutase
MPPQDTSSTIYLARHGETPWNLEGRWQGQTDIPLHDVGRQQARELAERLRGCDIVHVHTSDLSRARETADIVAASLGVGPVIVDADLRERRFGVFEGRTRAECETLGEVWTRFLSDRRCFPPGAEAEPDVVARMRRALDRVMARLAAAGGAGLIVSHGSALRSLLGQVTSRPIAPVVNGALFRLDVRGAELGDCVLLD